MKKTLSAAIVSAVLAVPCFAGCDKPSPPASIPDGKTAAMDDMMAAKKAVDAFKKDMERLNDLHRPPERDPRGVEIATTMPVFQLAPLSELT